jgi:acyl-CoA thioesterase
MTDAIFTPDGDFFSPTDLAGSPWGPAVLHGGPPAGLLARAVELSNSEPDMHVSRLTIDLFRPVPKQPLRTTTEVVREGRRIRVVQASLFAGDLEVSRASALFLRQSELELPEAHRVPDLPHDGPEGLPTGRLFSQPRGGEEDRIAMPPQLPGFHTTVEVKRAGGVAGSGYAIAWIRIPVPFIAGEETTPLVRMAATSDFGNALGNIRASERVGFINADITLYLHRPPEGEWICLETQSYAQPHGLGIVESKVYDAGGPVGRVVQALIVNARQG